MVSIIIVTYNAAQTLNECLQSVYSLADARLKIIVIDGQSTDGTVDILQRNEHKIEFWKSEKDHGIYDAMNKALTHVDTPWVYFLGADDQLLPDFSTFLNELKSKNIIYYGNVIYKGKKCIGKVSAYRQAKLGLFHQAIIYPMEVFKSYKYDLRFPIAADYALNMQLHKDSRFGFRYKDFTISKYNHMGISSIKADHEFEKQKSKLILRNFGFGIWARTLFRKFKETLYLAF
jgi:glycosyltransferase involved in cell wall biosynthesis